MKYILVKDSTLTEQMVREDLWEFIQWKKEGLKCVYINEANDQFGRKMNQNVSENRNLFWKE